MQTFRLRMAILASLAFAGLGFVPAGAEVPFPQQVADLKGPLFVGLTENPNALCICAAHVCRQAKTMHVTPKTIISISNASKKK